MDTSQTALKTEKEIFPILLMFKFQIHFFLFEHKLEAEGRTHAKRRSFADFLSGKTSSDNLKI